MKKTVAIMAGVALTGGMATAVQAQETQDYDPNRDIVTETERDQGTGMDTPRTDTPVQSEYETETQTESDMGTDPYGTESETQTDTYGTQSDPSQTETDTYGTQSDPSQTETGTEAWETDTETQTQAGTTDPHSKDIAEMSADKLSGKSVLTDNGEEIGQIDQVGYSSTHQERVAVVEAGGFLGVGQKRVAIPLSELNVSETELESVQTSMSRESIEAQEEFDDAGFTPDQEQMDQMNQ